MTPAEQLSLKLVNYYKLTYRCQVNLEGTINNMLLDGISIEKIKYYLEDIFDNVEFIYRDYDKE